MSYDLCKLTVYGDIPPVQRPVTGFDLVLQKIRIRLNRFRGEWPLDKTRGIDWLTFYGNPAVRPDEIVAAVVSELRQIRGVVQARVQSYSYDSANRSLSMQIDLVADGSEGVVRLGLQSRYPEPNGAPWAVTIGA